MQARKIISIILALVLVFAVFPLNIGFAFAAETEERVIVLSGTNSVTAVAGSTKQVTLANTEYGSSDLTDDFVWLGFKLAAETAGMMQIALSERNTIDGANAECLYWPLNGSHTNYLLKEGGIESSTTIANQGYISCNTDKFDGYVLINISEYFSIHSGYKNNDTDGKLTLSAVKSFKVWNNNSTSDWTISNVAVATSKEAFIDYFDLGVVVPDVDILTANDTVTVTALANDASWMKSVANAEYTNAALDKMEWLGFEANTADKAGTICIALLEKGSSNTAWYCPNGNEKTIYLMDNLGKIREQTVAANSGAYRIYLPANFNGYVLINIPEVFNVTHSAYKDNDDTVLTLSDVTNIRMWHSTALADWSFKNFAFAKTKEDFADYFIKMEYFADINADKEINAIDLVRLKRYNADNSVSISLQNADLVFDKTINALDLTALREYLLSGAYENDKEGLYFKTLREPDTEFITDGKLYVILDKTMPQALFYKTADGRYLFGAGDVTKETLTNSYTVNGSTYTPDDVTFEKTGDTTAEYSVTIKGVALSSSVTSDMSFTYRYTVKDGELVKEMLSLEGDDENTPLNIEESNPILTVYDTMSGAGIAASSTAYSSSMGYSGDEMIGLISDLSADSVTDSSFSFVWNDKLAASVYTESAYGNPYTAAVSESSAKTGTIYAGKYHHRLLGGERVQREDENGKITDVLYKSVIGFTADCNSTDTVDWQDAAIWLRAKIPQMPTDLRSYLNQGNWGQARLAIPAHEYSATGEKQAAATTVISTYGQFLEQQRRMYNLTDGVGKYAYCMVGWQGRGHDYGWPDLSEQPFNPALGDETTPATYKSLFEKVGGVLSFHINQSDISTTSKIYNEGSIYGNSSIATPSVAVSPSYFGWTSYNLSHYLDFTNGFVTNRQNAFVEKYYAPFIIYSDVMTEAAASVTGMVEEQYAKAREIQHWRSLGTYVATEYYSQDKYLNGQFLFINFMVPTTIDQFMTAGNIRINTARSNQSLYEEDERGIWKSDYIWGTVSNYLTVADTYTKGQYLYLAYSDENTSDINSTQNFAYNIFRAGFVNGMMGSAGILSYKETETGYETVWNNGIKAVYDSSTETTKIWNNGVLVSDDDAVFIESPDGEEKILVFTQTAQTLTRNLPESFAGYQTLTLYKLTDEGRVYVGEIDVSDLTVSFETEKLTSYCLVPNGEKTSVRENIMSYVAALNATSKNATGKYTDVDWVNIGNKLISVPKAQSPDGDWSVTLNGLYDHMIDANGGLLCEYPVHPLCTFDGDPETYWEPNANSAYGDIDMTNYAHIDYVFETEKTVKYVKITEASTEGSEVTSFRLRYKQADGTWKTCYLGQDGIPETEIDIGAYLSVTDISTTALRLEILTAKSNTPRIAEIAVYSE